MCGVKGSGCFVVMSNNCYYKMLHFGLVATSDIYIGSIIASVDYRALHQSPDTTFYQTQVIGQRYLVYPDY